MFSKNLKILIISNLYPSKESPYYGSFVKNFEDQLQLDKRVSQINGIYIRGLHGSKFNKLKQYLIFYIKIIWITLFRRFDLIYVHLISHSTLPLRFVNYFKKLPLVFNIHGEDLLVTTPLANKLLKLSLPLVKKSKWIVVPSNYFKIITIEKLPDYPQERIIVSASGGVKESFKPSDDRMIVNSTLKIGYVSRIDRGKGWETLLKSLKRLAEEGIYPEVFIVGGGPQVDIMKERIECYGLKNIHYLGPIAHDDLPLFYQTLDVFIFPTELRESLGLVGLEAMACGVPVIGSRIGGLTDYIKPDYNGYFFTPGEDKELADRIIEFINLSSGNKMLLSRNALTTAQKYRDQEVAKNLFDTIL